MKASRRFFFLSVIVLGILVAWPSPSRFVQAQDPKPTLAPPEASTKEPLVLTDVPPTKEPIPPTPSATLRGQAEVRPTKEPLPPTDVPPTKVPLPTLFPTKTLWPTVLPTTPSVGYRQTTLPSDLMSHPTAMSTRNAAERQLASSTPRAVAPIQAPRVLTATVTGIVYDDANDNGQREADEVGLPGVAVSVETGAGLEMVVTDASGVYSLPAIAGARVRVIVPAGWSTRKLESLPLERAGDFPLRVKNGMNTGRAAAITPLTITQSVIDFAPLIALGLGLGAVMGIGFLRTSRAVLISNRQLALLLVRMQRTSEKPVVFDSATGDRDTDGKVLSLLNQAGLDAVGHPLNIERVLSVTAGDCPTITALGQAGRAVFAVFTPLDAKAFRRTRQMGRKPIDQEVIFEHATAYPLGRLDEALTAGQAYPLDALNSGLFVADDLAAAYAFLAADLPVSVRTLPRTSRWTLFVAPLPKHDLPVHSSWRQRIVFPMHRKYHSRAQ